ncbi:MAG: hypothetical protein GY774_39410 [Planctomycetes bacterium]|nr:hypothetical protein [Planctomycetota bacterium]
MAEELSPESKLYIKEEIEKVRKENREEIEKVKSKTTKIFTTVVIVVGFLTGLGVYGAAKSHINSEIQRELSNTTIQNLTEDTIHLHGETFEHEKDANDILSKLKKFEQDPSKNGYACLGSIKLIWGTETSRAGVDGNQRFSFKKPFENNCFTVIPSLAGEIRSRDKTSFVFNRVDGYDGKHSFTYVAIGN